MRHNITFCYEKLMKCWNCGIDLDLTNILSDDHEYRRALKKLSRSNQLRCYCDKCTELVKQQYKAKMEQYISEYKSTGTIARNEIYPEQIE